MAQLRQKQRAARPKAKRQELQRSRKACLQCQQGRHCREVCFLGLQEERLHGGRLLAEAQRNQPFLSLVQPASEVCPVEQELP